MSAASSERPDVEGLQREWGLDPDDWQVKDVKVNTWDALAGEGEVVRMRQITLYLRRIVPLELIIPAVDCKPRPAPKLRRTGGDVTVVFLSDQHAPYHDPVVHQAVLAFLADVQPAEVVLGGDGGDFGTISKHRDNPAWNAPPQECLDEQFALYADYREAVPNARVRMLPGNHDQRLQNEQLLRAERTYGIRPAHIPGETQIEAYSMRHLLHLDKLHIEYVGPPREGDNYEHAEVLLCDDLVATHGWLTGPDSAKKHAEAMGQSVIFGHTHYQCLRPVVVYRNARPVNLWGIEAGCLCQLEGLGYSKRPKWVQGFATATLFGDGSYRPELATFVDGALYWRDHRYQAKPRLRAAA